MKLSLDQIQNLIKNSYTDYKKENLYGECPKCKHLEFGISLKDNHLFNCFRAKKCGFKGNIFTLLKFLGKSKEFLGDRDVNIFNKLESGLRKDEVGLDMTLPVIQPPLLWKRAYDDEYLRERGFSDYQFYKFEVGRSKLNKDYITFLVRQNGELTGYVSRSDRSKEWIDDYNRRNDDHYLRYNNSSTDFAKMLFGLDEIVSGTTDVILVEGIFSKTKTDDNLQLDLDVWLKCCATFGAKFSDYQIELLRSKGVKRLIFWFEADVLNKIKPIVAKASLYFDVKVCYLQGKDPNDIDSNQAFELMDQMRDWLDFNSSYIQSELKE